MTSLEMTPPPETLEDRAAEELASLVEDVYLIGKACKDYYADSLAFEKKTETFKQYLAENRETVLKLKDKFPTGFHNTRILIRAKMMTWAEFVQDCFGVSYQYIEKLLKQPATVAVVKAQKSGPTEKELLKAKVVELSSKVEELSAELEAKAAPTTSSEDDKPPAKILTAGINLPPQTTEPEYDEEATFDDVVHYFESLDDDEQVQQIHKLCNELGLEFESSNL
jgi:hypothetical protein